MCVDAHDKFNVCERTLGRVGRTVLPTGAGGCNTLPADFGEPNGDWAHGVVAAVWFAARGVCGDGGLVLVPTLGLGGAGERGPCHHASDE